MKIETYSGRYFDYTEPRAEDVDVEDVAHALSQVARFGGHTAVPYSVAEHALLCRRLAVARGASPEVAFAALHHDSHEAYVGDVVTPLKLELGRAYRLLVARVDEAVAAAFGIDPDLFHDPLVREVDQAALKIEAAALKRSGGRGPHWQLGDDAPEAPSGWRPALGPGVAKLHFLGMHYATSTSAANPQEQRTGIA